MQARQSKILSRHWALTSEKEWGVILSCCCRSHPLSCSAQQGTLTPLEENLHCECCYGQHTPWKQRRAVGPDPQSPLPGSLSMWDGIDGARHWSTASLRSSFRAALEVRNCVQTELSSLTSYTYLKHWSDAQFLTDHKLTVTSKQLPGFPFNPLLLGTWFASDTI